MQIVLGTNNQGKLKEFRQMFDKQLNAYQIILQSEFDVKDADETGLSFIENAIIKARHASKYSGLPAIADDSGICIEAFDQQPGIYSARWHKQSPEFETGTVKATQLLKQKGLKQSDAYFVCALVYVQNHLDPCPIVSTATWDGVIIDEPRGIKGFGYDPIFIPKGMSQTAAELEPEQKNQISHRAQALQSFVQLLKQKNE